MRKTEELVLDDCKMVISEFHSYRDGGTIVVCTNKGEFWLDYRSKCYGDNSGDRSIYFGDYGKKILDPGADLSVEIYNALVDFKSQVGDGISEYKKLNWLLDVYYTY